MRERLYLIKITKQENRKIKDQKNNGGFNSSSDKSFSKRGFSELILTVQLVVHL